MTANYAKSHPSRHGKPATPAMFEALEPRRLLSGSTPTTLAGWGESFGIDVGGTVTHTPTSFFGTPLDDDSAYAQVAAQEFSLITAENEMKWKRLQTTSNSNPNSYQWANADYIAQFAANNNQKLHGHTLMWHSATPNWVRNLSPSAFETKMNLHIENTLEHFGDSVAVWDVVNEAIKPSWKFTGSEQPNINNWRDFIRVHQLDANGDVTNANTGTHKAHYLEQKLGSNWIEKAFRQADAVRQANGHSYDLIYNDFDTEPLNKHADAVYYMLKDLLSQPNPVPIDGIGFQFHIKNDFNKWDEVADNFDRFAALGLKIYITELDIDLEDDTSTAAVTQQAQNFNKVMDLVVSNPSVTAVQTWGVTDKYTFLENTNINSDADEANPLLFDDNGAKKSAYYSFRARLASATPMARWTFNGNTEDKDDNNDGTLFNATGSPYTTGPIGQALELDGVDDYVAIDNLIYHGDDHRAVTVAGWVNTEAARSQMILSFDRNEYFRLEISGNAAGPGQVGWNVNTDIDTQTLSSMQRIDDGNWHHVAATFDGNTGEMKLYIDGQHENTLSNAGTSFGSDTLRYGFIGIGSEAETFNGTRNQGNLFDGSLDDLRVYRRALTEQEILDQFQDGNVTPPPPPAGSNLLTNGDFSQGLTGWQFLRSAANADATVDAGGGNAAFSVNDAGTADWHVRLRQSTAIEANRTYTVRFTAYSTNGPTSFGLTLQRDGSDGQGWNRYGDQTVNVTGQATTYEFQITALADGNAYLTFLLGGQDTDGLIIDDVSMV